MEDNETRTDTAFAIDWIDDVAREAAADVALGDVLAEVLTAPDSRAAQRSHRRTELVVVYKQDKQWSKQEKIIYIYEIFAVTNVIYSSFRLN